MTIRSEKRGLLNPGIGTGGGMGVRDAARLSRSMWGLSLALTAVSLLLLVLNLSHPAVHVFEFWIENTVIAVSFSTVGAVIASRHPENALGWLFCAMKPGWARTRLDLVFGFPRRHPPGANIPRKSGRCSHAVGMLPQVGSCRSKACDRTGSREVSKVTAPITKARPGDEQGPSRLLRGRSPQTERHPAYCVFHLEESSLC